MVIMMGSNFILTLTYMYIRTCTWCYIPARTFFVLFETETNSKVVYLL